MLPMKYHRLARTLSVSNDLDKEISSPGMFRQ